MVKITLELTEEEYKEWYNLQRLKRNISELNDGESVRYTVLDYMHENGINEGIVTKDETHRILQDENQQLRREKAELFNLLYKVHDILTSFGFASGAKKRAVALIEKELFGV